ncbi:CASP-like protein 3A1 [Magnolia sinica]|uniref:CASP-like protein 3A1 n=1 Tax=Magnolia sinica TaxID=86752 RepID=UPI002659952A|nr:CASP-like protein 3A1 [Magnolia sinica]
MPIKTVVRLCQVDQNKKTMTKGRKPSPEVGIQVQESKITADSPTMNGSLVPISSGLGEKIRRKAHAANAILRFLCLLSSTTSLSFMLQAEQTANISMSGFNLPIQTKWSYSNSFEFLVAVSAAVAAHSLIQLALSIVKLINKSLPTPSRRHTWILFAGDQIFAYVMMSAGSASAGVTNPNRMGIQWNFTIPNFCKPLDRFCNHVGVSISSAFFSCFLLASSALLDVLLLSKP